MIGYMARVQRLVDHKVKDTRLRFMLMVRMLGRCSTMLLPGEFAPG